MTSTIKAAADHYGFFTVWVEQYQTTDTLRRCPVIVDTFYQNGGMITATGWRVKKDGTPYARRQVVSVPVPADVREIIEARTNIEEAP